MGGFERGGYYTFGVMRDSLYMYTLEPIVDKSIIGKNNSNNANNAEY